MPFKICVKIVIVYTAVCLGCTATLADDQLIPLYEQKIKAGLVYNLLKYTEWPKISIGQMGGHTNETGQTGEKLHICLFGDDPFDGYLSPLEGRTAQQAIIAIDRITQVQQSERCSVVIIHRNQEHQLRPLLQFLQGRNVLTISDMAQFAEHGGMVELTRHNEKVGLFINKESLDRAKLRIDERMLKLAKIISGKAGA